MSSDLATLPKLGSVVQALRTPNSTNHKILRAVLTVGCLSTAVKVVATAKELAVASFFGRSDSVDAFLIAYMIPAFVTLLVATSMNSALVPTFIQVRTRKGEVAAQQLFASAMLCTVVLLLGVMLVMAASGTILVRHLGSGFPPAKMGLTLRLFYALLPLVILNGIASNCGAVLNACGRFSVPALTPFVTPALTLALLLTRAHQWGVMVLVIGAVVGALAEAVIIAISLRHRGFHFELRWYGRTPAILQVRSQYVPLLAAGLLSSGVTVVDQGMAAMLEPGSVAALSYGNRIVSVIAGLVTASLSTAIIPYLSEMVAERDWDGCRRTLRTYTHLVSVVMVPAVALLVLGSHVVVKLLYQRGAFTATDTALVARIQAMYALQLSFTGVGMLYGRLLVAMKRNDLIMISAAINLGLDVVLNIVCMRLMGVAGIALATSMFYFGSFMFVRVMATRLLQRESQYSVESSSCV